MPDKDLLRTQRILANYERLQQRLTFTKTTQDSFVNDTSEAGLLAYDAIMIIVLQIVEDASSLSDSLKETIPSQPWRNIKGFRNLIAHAYYQVDKEMAWDVVDRDIPALCKALSEDPEER